MLSKKFNTALDSVKELTLRGHFTDAHKALDKLLKKDPTSKDLLNTKANIYIYQGFYLVLFCFVLFCFVILYGKKYKIKSIKKQKQFF